VDEATAVARVRSGQVDAFAEIIDLYEAPILRYLARMTGDAELARDLAQDTFLQAFKSIVSTNSELMLKAWLYKIATNNALQHHRRRKILSFIPFLNFAENDIPEPRNGPRLVDDKIDVQRALLGVPIDQRTALVLHYVEGLKYREIADVLSTTEEAIRKRVARGSEAFRLAYLPPADAQDDPGEGGE
jgi:RNA polymerase sigma-70 factor, ECF subfamily